HWIPHVKCRYPLKQGVMEFGCGRCMPCRINRRREWTSRMMLELQGHTVSWFVTLTYAPEFLPEGGTLVPKHAQDWLKRLRTATGEKIRFYLVGEYGDKSWRPHYHAILFGGPSTPDPILATWHFGLGHVGFVTAESIQYVASYVEKKMTSSKDDRLNGRYPEFARMSRKPGIGALAVDNMFGKALTSKVGVDAIIREGDVPSMVRFEGKKWPLGRYLRSRARAAAGFEELGMPEDRFIQMALERQATLSDAEAFYRHEADRVNQEATAKARAKIRASKRSI
ncbi:replication initiator protein, partial [Apis mellifera associated microvirus 50]